MRLERIISIHGGKAQTQSGLFPIIGNANMAAGQIVPAFDGYVVGRVNPVGRRPAAKFMAPAVSVLPETQYYHFADASALKMYYVDTEFSEIVKTEDVTAPVDGAELVLHCYNADAEYLVWFLNVDGSNSRCIIQKNGETIADLTSVFPNIPSSGMTDAYIDSSGNLIWVAATEVGDVITMAKLSNGSVIDQKMYLYSAVETAIGNRLTEFINGALVGVSYSETNTQSYETTDNCVFPRSQYWGTLHKVVAVPAVITYPALVSVTSSSSTFTIYDLWGLNAIIQISAGGYGSVAAKVHATYFGWQTGKVSSESDWFLASVAPEARVGWNYSFVDGVLIEAIIPGQDTYFEEYSTSTKNAEHITELVSLNEVITGAVSSSMSEEEFFCTFTMPEGYEFGTVAPSYCTLIFTSGANIGLARTAMLDYWSSSDPTHYKLKFDPEWPNAPVAGDTFELEVSYGTYKTTETTCEPSIRVSLARADGSGSCSVGTDLDNGYSLRYSIGFAEPDGQALPVQTIKKSGATIYTTDARPQYFMPSGAWCADANSPIGLLINNDNKLIRGSAMTDFGLFNGTVTKRFVAKSEEV